MYCRKIIQRNHLYFIVTYDIIIMIYIYCKLLCIIILKYFDILYRRALENKHEMSVACLRGTNEQSQPQLNNFENMYHLQEMEKQNKLDQQRREAEINRQQRLQAEQQELQRQQYEVENRALETQRQEAEQRELERLEAERIEAERIEAERIEAERIEAERREAERIEAQRIEAELSTQRKLQSSSFMHQHHTSSLAADAEEHLLGLSLTVNTKEALTVVQSMWHSPDATAANTPRFRSPITPRMVDSRSKMLFDIHMDGSMTQHAMSNSKHHQGYSMQVYNDQENHQSYHTPHHSYPGQEQQAAYGNHGLQNSFHYQIQVRRIFLIIFYTAISR